MRPTKPLRPALGFTLIEAIVVIVITGIIFTSVAMFLRVPIAGAVDTSRRAALVDIADTSLRRMSREIHTALPNSVRITTDPSKTYIEFLPIVAGGRYCSEPDSGGVCSTAAGSANNPLDFSTTDASFEVIGPLVTPPSFSATGTSVAIYNLGIPGADAYNGDNTVAVASVTGTTTKTVNFSSARQFPFASPAKRFHIISSPVSYVCTPSTSGTDGTGTLIRYTGYAIQATQPTSFSVTGTKLATRVASCSIDYTQAVIARDGLLSILITLKQQGESISLTHEIQIHNAP